MHALKEAHAGPSAERQAAVGWRNGRVLFGVVLLLVATLSAALLLRAANRTAPVYVASRALPAGSRVGVGDLRVVNAGLPASQRRVYLAPTTPSMLGRLTIVSIAAGQFVPRADLVPAGGSLRVALVDLPAAAVDAVQGALAPGDHVEVLATVTNAQGVASTSVLLADVEIRSVGTSNSGFGSANQFDGVVVAVSPRVLPQVAQAVTQDKLTIARLDAAPQASRASKP